jgi:putative colanic acid biosynthesis glycosyltransferase
MKVLFINTVDGRGSTGNIIREIGAAIEIKGHEYKVAYGRFNSLDATHAYRIGNNINVSMHAAFSKITDKTGFYSSAATHRFVRFIKKYKPDIIHLHNLHGYYINVKLLFHYLKTEYTGRVIWTLHDCWSFTGHCAYYSAQNCNKWKTGCHHCELKKNYPSSLCFDRSRKNYADKKNSFQGLLGMKIVTVSEWLASEVRKSFLNEYYICTIYNGINTALFHPVEINIREKLKIGLTTKLVLSVSDGWNERKGFGDICKIAALKIDYTFLVVGVDKKLTGVLPSNVIVISRLLNKDELVAVYSTADVFINPSREETFGLVTAEALACGTPVVVYNTTACPEIPDCSCGIIVKCFDWVEMAKAVTHIIESNAYKQEDCRRRAEACFNMKHMTDKYCKLYEE